MKPTLTEKPLLKKCGATVSLGMASRGPFLNTEELLKERKEQRDMRTSVFGFLEDMMIMASQPTPPGVMLTPASEISFLNFRPY